jgi:hypothetical protein
MTETERDNDGPRESVHLAEERDVALPGNIFDIDFDLSDTREELRKKIGWIVRIRFVVNPAVFLLMFFANWHGLTKGVSAFSTETLYSTGLTTGVSLVLNLVYTYALRRGRFDLRKFVFLQLALDVLIFSAYLWRTGGVTSPFPFLYVLPILGASMLLSPGAGVAMAGLSSLGYLGVVVLESFGALPHVSYFVALDRFTHRAGYVTLMVIVNLFSFFLVSGAAGFLMRTIRGKTLELRDANARLDRKAGLFQTLYQVSELLQERESLDEILDGICDVLVTRLNVDRALMYVADGGELVLRRVSYHRRVPASSRASMRVRIPLDPREGLTARCAVENRACNVTDPTKQEGINAELAQQIGLNPFALAPMAYRGAVLGVLGIDRSVGFGTIGDDELDVLKMFARQAAQTLDAALAKSRR